MLPKRAALNQSPRGGLPRRPLSASESKYCLHFQVFRIT